MIGINIEVMAPKQNKRGNARIATHVNMCHNRDRYITLGEQTMSNSWHHVLRLFYKWCTIAPL